MSQPLTLSGIAEEAVRREVLEEAGLRVGPVAIVGSQPWPIGGLPCFATQHEPWSLLTAAWTPHQQMPASRSPQQPVHSTAACF